MTTTCTTAAPRVDASSPVRSALRRWLELALEARRQHLESRDAIELELLDRTHRARGDEFPRTPESLRDAYRVFGGGDPLRLL